MRSVVTNYLWNHDVNAFVVISAEELKRIPKMWVEYKTFNKHLELFNVKEYTTNNYINGKKIERLQKLKFYIVKTDE